MGRGPGLMVGRIVFPLARATNLIGRTDRSSGIFPDIDISPFGGGRQISRRHTEIARTQGSFFARDLGSHLGTLINGEAIGDTARELSEGDAITIGDVTLRFSLECEWPEGLLGEWETTSGGSTATQPAMDLPLIAQLPEALADGQLMLHYQPQVVLATGEVPSVEALIRWEHPAKGMISPERYISLAEDTGFIRVLTSFTLEQAAAARREWAAAGTSVRVGVNLSVIDLEDPAFGRRALDAIDFAIEAGGIQPNDFALEVTESAVMFNPGVAIATLDRLRSLGFGITIDDFGTGHSSLAYLKDLPADEIKLDKSFAADLTEREQAIIGGAVQMAHDLGLAVVAEGIEDEATSTFLRDIGCDKGQGYHFGKPVPKEEVDLSRRSVPAR